MNRLPNRRIPFFRLTSFLFVPILMAVIGCQGPVDPTNLPDPTPTPVPSNPYKIEGTWQRNDNDQNLFIATDGTVLSESLALDPATEFRNVVPCDGQNHLLSQVPENGIFTQLQVRIGTYKVQVDANGKVTMDQHVFQETWVTDTTPTVDMTVSGTGQMTSPTSFTIQTLKEPTGIRQNWTYTKISE